MLPSIPLVHPADLRNTPGEAEDTGGPAAHVGQGSRGLFWTWKDPTIGSYPHMYKNVTDIIYIHIYIIIHMYSYIYMYDYIYI